MNNIFKILLVMNVCLIQLQGFSQISLSKTNTPQSKYRYYFNKVSIGNLSIDSLGGANKIWNFINISVLNSNIQEFYTQDTNFVSFSHGCYSNQNLKSDTSLLRTNNAIYKVTDNRFSLAYKESNIYSGPYSCGIGNINLTKMNFPFTYNDSLIETWSSFSEGGSIKVKADAFGTLILPDTTFTNVLRVNTKFIDNSYPPHNHYSSTNYSYNIYEWYTLSSNRPVLSISCRSFFTSYYMGNNFGKDTTVYLFVNSVNLSSVDKLTSIDELQIYPNPVKDELIIELKISERSMYTVELFDLLSKKILILEQKLIQGLNKIRINTVDLPHGIYVLKCTNEKGKIITKKIQKQ